jgi:hypothetical protein
VFEWVSDSLRDPSRIYELITPARRPLVTSAGSVKQADLLPSAMLNFRLGVRGLHCMLQVFQANELQEPWRLSAGGQHELGTLPTNNVSSPPSGMDITLCITA